MQLKFDYFIYLACENHLNKEDARLLVLQKAFLSIFGDSFPFLVQLKFLKKVVFFLINLFFK